MAKFLIALLALVVLAQAKAHPPGTISGSDAVHQAHDQAAGQARAVAGDLLGATSGAARGGLGADVGGTARLDLEGGARAGWGIGGHSKGAAESAVEGAGRRVHL